MCRLNLQYRTFTPVKWDLLLSKSPKWLRVHRAILELSSGYTAYRLQIIMSSVCYLDTVKIFSRTFHVKLNSFIWISGIRTCVQSSIIPCQIPNGQITRCIYRHIMGLFTIGWQLGWIQDHCPGHKLRLEVTFIPCYLYRIICIPKGWLLGAMYGDVVPDVSSCPWV